MPIITVALYSGGSQREKDRLAEAITEDTAKILKIEKEGHSSIISRSASW